jgi:hypothetical protein
MAHGRISLPSHACKLAMNFSGFSTTFDFVVTTLQTSFPCVLGLSFLKKNNPIIDLQTVSLKFDGLHILSVSTSIPLPSAYLQGSYVSS